MKALVYYGPQVQKWEDKPEPKICFPTDAIVRMKKTTICGTDLHIMKGNVPTVDGGRILGHEGIGVIEEIGPGVTEHQVGDTVLISCITSCGKCANCKKGSYGHCLGGGWMLGNTIDGCQAEYVRIPHADNSLHQVPADADEEALVMLSDILPTGLEVGVLEGKVQPGCTLAIVGAGPVGLAALLTAQFYSPARIFVIDRDHYRLKVAESMGATDLIDNSNGTAIDELMKLTQGIGVDVVIEAIGTPAGWDISENSVAAGGNIAILGVHGKSVTLHLERMWKRNFTMTAGLVHTTTIPMLMRAVQSGRIQPRKLISHYLGLSEMTHAYELFGSAANHQTLKVMMTNDISKAPIKKRHTESVATV
ncbi:threonine(-3-)dehydrogenase [Legionella steigerwaltii]|uniref:Threonine(-3-)dehydrogenase n=1 Tax=Legionella steigerwaltii TaxID=460 RepID=A0A378LBH0_9GAMM|nr:zinc-dependent alcohol dehydrogenase family protein [Legionella steigerwaltii]KTD81084.1 threonine(-3-)dehydrogenase [Legionella steigerwaltii]STY23228.1 threonine(-3-)dehydrogenase [Legionella steigerwaltii]